MGMYRDKAVSKSLGLTKQSICKAHYGLRNAAVDIGLDTLA
jgi:hypothetical protein